jgi:3-oxoadipate enol-lactonase
MRCVAVGKLNVHVEESGDPDGLPVVFSNSLGTDLRVWDRLLPLLPSGLRFVRYDSRGHGLSDGGEAAFAISDLADDLAGLLDRLGVESAVVCGLSVGGVVAQDLAARRPERVRALVLCDTAARIGPAEMWDARIRAVESGGVAALADAVLERWFTARFRREEPELALWRNMLARTSPAGYAATCAAIRDADLTETTRRLRLPTLAVVGDEDGATPPELVRETAALIPGSRFAVIPGAGHLPPVEAPEALARLIADFLEETAGA